MAFSPRKIWYGPALWQAFLIAATALFIYWPALHGSWLMDDELYLTHHPLLYDSARLWKTWFVPGSFFEYYPLGETIQWAQWQLWGPNPLGYHLTNLALHILNGLLVWWLLKKLGLRLAWIGGLLFVVHPSQVESVAWIAEFKNVVSLPFFLLAMGFYLDYDRTRRPRNYVLSLLCFTLALLGKITMAPFAFVILLYVWWRRGRIGWRDVGAAVPFLIVAVALALTSIQAGIWYTAVRHLPGTDPQLAGPLSRLVGAGLALSFYLLQAVWPLQLSPIYPRWEVDPAILWQWLPLVGFALAAIWFWRCRAGWGRHALFALGYFTLMLAPFLGFNAVSYQEFTWVMDHFLYLPLLAVVALEVALLDLAAARLPEKGRWIGGGALALLLGVLTWRSHDYASAFVSSEANSAYVVVQYPGIWVAHNNLGSAWWKRGLLNEAIAQFQEAARLKADYLAPRTNLGALFMRQERYDEALAAYQDALQVAPTDPEALNGMGSVLVVSGKPEAGLPYYQKALQTTPGFTPTYNNMSFALMKLGRLPEARAMGERAVQLRPFDAMAFCTLGLVLKEQGDMAGALAQFQQAHKLDPQNAGIWRNVEMAQQALDAAAKK